MGSSCGRMSADEAPTRQRVRKGRRRSLAVNSSILQTSGTQQGAEGGVNPNHHLHEGDSTTHSNPSAVTDTTIEEIYNDVDKHTAGGFASPKTSDDNRLLIKMEARMGLTPEEIEQVNRIVRAAPSYLQSHRSKLIQFDMLNPSPISPPLVYPTSPGSKPSRYLSASQHSSYHTYDTTSQPGYPNISPHDVGSSSGVLVDVGGGGRNSVRLFDASHNLLNSTTVDDQSTSVSIGGGGMDSDAASPHFHDPHLSKMIEESRKKCYQSWLVWRCWKSVLDREDTGLETSFVELLHRSGSHVLGGERSDMFVNFINRGKPVMDMVTNLVENGLDNAKSVYALHELGARHVAYGVTRQDYEGYTGPFVRTVEMCARPGTMNSQVRRAFRQFWQGATEMMLEGAVESRGAVSLKQAPKTTPFAIVFTDIEGSTALWENQPVAMEKAVDEHHKLVRDLIHDHNGYEVKTIGDSFMIAFRGLADAVTMALRLQVELLRASVEGLVVQDYGCESSGPRQMWNPAALRVRVGVHWCTDASPKFDVVYKRYDYYGNDVNVASRVQDAACGGQVLVSEATLNAIQQCGPDLDSRTEHCGSIVDRNHSKSSHNKASLRDVLQTSTYIVDAELKGVQEPITLHSLYPKVLEQRVYGKRKKDVFVE